MFRSKTVLNFSAGNVGKPICWNPKPKSKQNKIECFQEKSPKDTTLTLIFVLFFYFCNRFPGSDYPKIVAGVL